MCNRCDSIYTFKSNTMSHLQGVANAHRKLNNPVFIYKANHIIEVLIAVC